MASLKSILEEYGYMDKEEKQEAKDVIEEICGEDFTASQFNKWRKLISKYDIELSEDFEEDIQLYQNYYEDEESAENSYKIYSMLISSGFELDGYSDFYGEYENHMEINIDDFKSLLSNPSISELSLEEIFDLSDEVAEYDMNDTRNKKILKLLCTMRTTLDNQDISFEEAQTILEAMEDN